MKNYLIKKNERESILYSIFQELKYLFGKILNFYNYIKRKENIKNFFSSHEDKKIQFGAGSGKYGEADISFIKGFLDTDIFGKIPVDVNFKLPFESSSIDIIFSSHLIEHIYQRKMDFFLQESFRILNKNGKIIVATPSLEKIIKILYSNDAIKRNIIYSDHKEALMGRKPTVARIINALTHINYGHKFLLDFQTFENLAANAGFNNIKNIDIKNIDDIDIKNYLLNKNEAYKIQTEIFYADKKS